MKASMQERIASAIRNLPLPYTRKVVGGMYVIFDGVTKDEVGNVIPYETNAAPAVLFEDIPDLKGYLKTYGIRCEVLPKFLR